MHILVLTHYFPREIGAPQARLSELARHWAAVGDDVVDGYHPVRTWLAAAPQRGRDLMASQLRRTARRTYRWMVGRFGEAGFKVPSSR